MESTRSVTRLVDIVIVNWNSGNLLRDCLASISAHSQGLAGVIVVDNGSSDGSADVEDENSGLPIEVIRTGSNLGFGKACNIGSRAGSAPYILFLNPDAALFEDTLRSALDFMNSAESADIGVCGARLEETGGSIQAHCANFPTVSVFLVEALGLTKVSPRFKGLFMTGFDHKTSRDVDHVIGAFYLVRRRAFEQVGGFDERFFMYLEDLDLSLRVRRAGWRVRYNAEVTAFHKGGGTSEKVMAHRLFYSRRSRLQYARKHFGPTGSFVVMITTLFLEPLALIARSAVRRSGREMKDTARGVRWLWRDTLFRRELNKD